MFNFDLFGNEFCYKKYRTGGVVLFKARDIYMQIKNNNGFTIIELVLILLIIGIMAAMAVPNFLSWQPDMRLKAAARDLYSNMQKAKIAAVKSNTTVVFNFTQGTGTPCQGGSYSFVNGLGETVASSTMANKICLSTSTAFPTGFTSRGLSSIPTGRIDLTHPDSSRTYTITQSVPGNIKLQ